MPHGVIGQKYLQPMRIKHNDKLSGKCAKTPQWAKRLLPYI